MNPYTLRTLFLYSALLPPPALADTHTSLSIGYAEACPHMCPYDENKGFTTDIAKAVLEMQGWNVRFVALPWARVVANTNTGQLNAAISTGKNESPLLIYPTEELATQEDCFYGAAGDMWKPEGAHSFKIRKTIVFSGWVLEAPYREALGDQLYDSIFEKFSIDKDYHDRSVNLVIRKRMHAFWSDSTVFSYYQSKKHSNRQTK